LILRRCRLSERIVIAIMKPGNPYISTAAAAAGKITINRKTGAEYYQTSTADLYSGKCSILITSAEQLMPFLISISINGKNQCICFGRVARWSIDSERNHSSINGRKNSK